MSWAGDVADATARYGLGRVIRDGLSLTASRIEVEAQGTVGPAVITLFGSRARFNDAMTVVRDTTYIVAGFPFRGRYRTETGVWREYMDAEVRATWQFRTSTWGVALGARRGDATTSSERWQQLDLSLPLNPNVALIATGGRRPAVPEERLPSGAFAVFGVQLSLQRDPPPLAVPVADGRDTPRLVAMDVGDGRRSISIIGLRAQRVEIIADFTDWRALDLAAVSDQVWNVTIPIAPGAHRVSIRVDGRVWVPPPGLPVAADEFMGTVGILLIE